MSAQIVSLVVNIDGKAGLTLWGPEWLDSDGEYVEAFIGDDHRIPLFATAQELHSYVVSAPQSGLAEHPAWPGVTRKSPEQLRASAADIADFDAVFDLFTGPSTPHSVNEFVKVLRVADAIARTCADTELTNAMAGSDYVTVLDDPSLLSGPRGEHNWRTVAKEVASSWEWVIGRVRQHLDFRGSYDRADNDAILLPPAHGAWQQPLAPQYGGGAFPGAASFGQPGEYSGLAIASLVLALLPTFGLPSVICGHLGLRDIRRTGKRGRGLAIAGLIIGYFGLAITLVFVVSLVAVASA